MFPVTSPAKTPAKTSAEQSAVCSQSKVADKEAYQTPSSAKAFSWRGYVRGPWFKYHKSSLDLEESQDLDPSTKTLSFNFGNIRHT